MSSDPRLRASVQQARQRLAEGRQKLQSRHNRGTPGIQVSAALTDLFDTVVLDLYESAMSDLGEAGPNGLRSQIALVPHGGYGRCDVAPYSDVDLMILHAPAAAAGVVPLAARMTRDLFDAGLVLGHSVRTPRVACQLARREPKIWTSLVESRYLAGSVRLYSRYAKAFRTKTRRRIRALCAAIESARQEERTQFGETVYLLEPNIKRSVGGLREIQLLRWLGFARYATADPDGLQLRGALSRADREMLTRATSLLLRMRNEMHFHAGKSRDVLDRAEQVRLAEVFGFRGREGMLPVEQFMQEYFRTTAAVSNLVSRFFAGIQSSARIQEWFSPLVTHQMERDFRVGPVQITTTSRGLAKIKSDMSEVLRMADLANLYNKRIAHATCEEIREAIPSMSDEVTPAVAERTMSLMSQPARLGELLRFLHQTGALEKILPGFAHARGLLQFNNYHKYTVDEHCLRAVESATELLTSQSILGDVYRSIRRKGVLHLALLTHDIGKGFTEDHSVVGLRLAEETAVRLRLSERDAEALKFLVHQHLLMSHLAFRRDTSDNQVVVRFAVAVGSPELLKMLYVLTACDFSAVGPGVWNQWKADVLAELYSRAMEHLAGDRSAMSYDRRLEQRRQNVLDSCPRRLDPKWFAEQVSALPNAYLDSRSNEDIREELIRLESLEHGDVAAKGRYLSESKTVEYTVGTYEDITSGVFHRLVGALASRGLQVLSAQINTLAHGLVLDRFFVHDPDFEGEPPQSRLDEVTATIVKSLRNPTSVPKFRRFWNASGGGPSSTLDQLPTQVRVDNSTSEQFTIIDIFAADRSGLLYTIAVALFELDLSVSVAKIGTYLDQVVDVFYVTDSHGKKIEDETRLHDIRKRLHDDVEALEREESAECAKR